MKKASASSIRLDHRRRGYMLDGTLQEGFPDRADLSTEQRTLIARWAEHFTPDRLTDTQRQLLSEAPEAAVPVRQRELAQNQRELHSAYLSIIFDSLSEEEKWAIQDPAKAGITSTGYPLSVGELSELTGASERQVRRWADEGLLPMHRQGNNRRFYSAAAIRAFALQLAPVHSKAIAAAAARGEVGRHFQLLAATLAHTAARMPADLAQRLIALAEDLSSSSRLMADVNDSSELVALWRQADEGVWEELSDAITLANAEAAEPQAPARSADDPDDGITISARPQYKPHDPSDSHDPIEVSEADEVISTRYGGSEPFEKRVVVTAPRREGGWVNRVSGRKSNLSVHSTKEEAEEEGREVARQRHGRHVVYRGDGSSWRSRSYD